MLLWMKQEPLRKLPNANGEKILSGSVPFGLFSVRSYRAVWLLAVLVMKCMPSMWKNASVWTGLDRGM